MIYKQTKISLLASSYAYSSVYRRFDKTSHSNLIIVEFIVWLYSVDPPYAPIKDRMVSNVTLEGNMTAQQDYRFTAVVTWNPPVYPYKTPFMYLVKWFIEDSLQQAEVADFRLSVSKYTFLPITSLTFNHWLFYAYTSSKVNCAPGATFICNVFKQLIILVTILYRVMIHLLREMRNIKSTNMTEFAFVLSKMFFLKKK